MDQGRERESEEEDSAQRERERERDGDDGSGRLCSSTWIAALLFFLHLLSRSLSHGQCTAAGLTRHRATIGDDVRRCCHEYDGWLDGGWDDDGGMGVLEGSSRQLGCST